jgi:leucyl aminopeptidase
MKMIINSKKIKKRSDKWIQLGQALVLGCMFAKAYGASDSLPEYEQFQVSQCLAQQIKVPHKVLAENKRFKIIDLSSADLNQLNHEADSLHCGRFLNVSRKVKGASLEEKKRSAQNILQKKLAQDYWAGVKPIYEINHQKEVNTALKNIVPDNIWQTVSHLTSYFNRSASTDTGLKTAHWLKLTFESMVIDSDRRDAHAYFVTTGPYQQPSLVTVIGENIKVPGIVIGAHMDTLDGRMPGAGDDGSGSASIMEMARVLLSSHKTFKRPIYIIWYAAEERGLLGSQYVVEHFQRQGIPIKAAIQFDMTGYRSDPQDPTMWVYTDYVDKNLSNFVAQLISFYVQVPVGYTECGYGCSDHVSWDTEGIPAAFPSESSFEDHNPYIHSSADTMDLLNLEHMVNFSKLALAFALELALE